MQMWVRAQVGKISHKFPVAASTFPESQLSIKPSESFIEGQNKIRASPSCDSGSPSQLRSRSFSSLIVVVMIIISTAKLCETRWRAASQSTSANNKLDLMLDASNHTSYFLDIESNATGAAKQADQRALDKWAATKAAQADEDERPPYENISLVLPSKNQRVRAGRTQLPPANQIKFDEVEGELEDADVASQLSDDGGGEQGDYEDEEESDFYTRNPVDSMTLDAEEKAQKEALPRRGKKVASSSGKTNEKRKFDDFDDFQAMDLGSFYEQSKPRIRKTKLKRFHTNGKKKKRKKKTILSAKKNRKLPDFGESGRLARASERLGAKRNKRLEVQQGDLLRGNNASESRQQEASATSQDDRDANCALMVESGQCITFDSVEWAIRRARRLINFAQPQARALNSLEPSESTISAIGELVEWTTRVLARRFRLSSEQVHFQLEQLDVSQTSLWRSCPRLFRSPQARACPTYEDADLDSRANLVGRFRSYTGACNNPLLPHLGSSFMPFARLMPAEYADGVGSMRRSSSSGTLPPPRLISLQLHPSLDLPTSDVSALFPAWGQLINHDLALASGARPATGHEGSCCTRGAILAAAAQQEVAIHVGDPLERVCAPILIDRQDALYGPHGVRCHDFKRSVGALRPGCSLGPRTQLNLVSSFVDGSFVYGSTNSVARSLRSSNGRLASWDYFRSRRSRRQWRRALKPLLPPQVAEPDEECVGRPRGLFCFRSGDARTNQQVPLVVLHTLHMRQHNRLADALSQLNPHWSSGRVFEEARKLHVAQIQHILISEYLPLLLGQEACETYNLTESQPDDDYWHAYEPLEQPGIAQEFAAAAFRQGHSSVPNEVFRFRVSTRLPTHSYPLRELFRRPWPLFEPLAMDEFALGLLETAAQSVDPFVSLELSGHLLEEPGEPVGLDLIAINIQRGRDQGVASYNAAREWCGLERLDDFGALDRVMSVASAQLMANLYESVDDIDLYSGGLAEWPLEGAQVGATFACIIGRQFRALRSGDRHWFEASPLVAPGPQAAFTPQQLASIKQFTLARLVCANSDQLGVVQASAMQLPHPILNPLVACAQLPDVDLSLWLEAPPPPPAQSDDGNGDEDDEQE